MVYCINVYLDSFNNIYLIKGYVNFYIELKPNLLPLNVENSDIQWTKLYILLQTRQKCYVSFWLYFTPCYNSEKKPLLHKVRVPSGFVNVMPYVRSILRASFFFPIVLFFNLSTSNALKTFYLVKATHRVSLIFSFILLVEVKYINIFYKMCS